MTNGRHRAADFTENAYTESERPSPKLYSELVAENHRIQLAGYEVFHFGGYELSQPDAEHTVMRFFDELLPRTRQRGSGDGADGRRDLCKRESKSRCDAVGDLQFPGMS